MSYPGYPAAAYGQPAYAAYAQPVYAQPATFAAYGAPAFAQPQQFATNPAFSHHNAAYQQAQSVRATGANPEYTSYGVPTTGPDFTQANTPLDPSNLFIQGLPLDIDEHQLRAMFEPFGTVVSTKIMMDPVHQSSRGFGFVKFTNPTSASTAIESMHEATVSGKKLSVRHAALTSRSANVGQNSIGTPNPNLYIRGLPPSITNEELQQLFAQYGTIEQSRILMDSATGLSKGQAFVRYDSVEAATYSIQALNGYTFDGQIPVGILVKYADTDADKAARAGRGGPMGASRGGRFQPYPRSGFQGGYGDQSGAPRDKVGAIGPNGEANLFVYHLPPDADDSFLTQLFGNYGTIISTRVMRDPATGLCKGFGFVKLANVESANAAIAALDGYQVGNKRLSVSFKK